MKWSYKIGRLAGIDIQIHLTFLLLVAWVALSYWQLFGTLQAVLNGLIFIAALFFCVVLHELGHALTARHYGIATRNITLLPIGGVASMERMPDDPMEEVKVALAGPAVSFTIAFILWILVQNFYPDIHEQTLAQTDAPLVIKLMVINFILGAFNLIPAFPMDGGRVLRALLATRFGHHKATTQAAKVGQGFAVIAFVLGLLYNPFLMFIALFIWLGATAESTTETIKSKLHNIQMTDAMVREFHVLNLSDNLQKAVDLTLQTTQKDFPVRDPGKKQLFYQLTQNELIEAINNLGAQTPISQLNLKKLPLATLQEPVEDLLQKLTISGTSMVAVLDKNELVGLVDMDNLREIIKLLPDKD